MRNTIILILCATGLLLGTRELSAVELVTKESVEKQKKLTKIIKLSNKIPVIYRQVKGSDIVHLSVQFSYGNKDLSLDKKAILGWLTSVMPRASKAYPKQKALKLVDKYSIISSCSQGVETSHCDLNIINDFWNKSLDFFADYLLHPSLDPKDAQLAKDNLLASNKRSLSDPGANVNNVVNRVFYDAKHPYRGTTEEIIKSLEKLTVDDLKAAHGELLNASSMTIIVATSMPAERVIGELNAKFGNIKSSKLKTIKPYKPKYEPSNAFSLENKDIPTAYMRLKVNAPSATDKDAVATRLMFEILSEKMFDEIRAKRSLSYSPYAGTLMMSVGLGVFDITSPKPKLAIEALRDLINEMKNKPLSAEELNEHKNIYATRYFVRQETHGALVGALGRSYRYFKTPNAMYEMPFELAKVTPEDVTKAAHKYLKNMRLGVIYDEKKFDKKWLKILP